MGAGSSSSKVIDNSRSAIQGIKPIEPNRFSAVSTELAIKMASGDYFVGKQLALRGTGQWWTGGNYLATVVDLRDNDDTIKVQYQDGGFKRFTRDRLAELLVVKGAGIESWVWEALRNFVVV